MDSDSQALAAYLHGLREARWARLSPEAAAELAWPHFVRAVAAANHELRTLPGLRPTEEPDDVTPADLPDLPPA